MRRLLLAAGLALASPASAQSLRIDESAWSAPGDEAPRPIKADISVPRAFGPLTLRQLLPARPGGWDNVAQYGSDDRALVATIYIYRPVIADAGFAAIMTTEAIFAGFGREIEGGPRTLAPAGGVAQAAHRQVYLAGLKRGNGPALTLATGFAVLKAGQWLVKVRVTGPAQRRDEIERALDGLLGELRFGADAVVKPAYPDTVTECPDSGSERPARRQSGKAAGPFAAMSGILADSLTDLAKGPRALCVMVRRTGPAYLDIVLRATKGDGTPLALLSGDSGNGVYVIPPLFGGGTGWGALKVGVADGVVFGPFDAAPTADQLMAIPTGGDIRWAGQGVARLTRDEKGKTNVAVDVNAFK